MEIHVKPKHELPYNYPLFLVAYMSPAEMAESADVFLLAFLGGACRRHAVSVTPH